jgi:hypothetical protein
MTWQKEKTMVVDVQKRAFGVFPSRKQAEQALNELKDSGFSMDKVSIIAKQAEENDQLSGAKMSDRVGDRDVESTTSVVGDAMTGATWGTVLVGLTSLALPGIGPILAAGSLGAGLIAGVGGMALGASNTAGLVKALADLGIPAERAEAYSDRLVQGDYLVIVDGIEEEIHRAEEIFKNGDIQAWIVFDAPAAKAEMK